jgi:DNA-binding transcriptional regulator YiaG
MTSFVRLAQARQLGPSGLGRSIRVAARLSLRDMARWVGVDPATVHRWETGKSVPAPEHAERWLDALAELADLATAPPEISRRREEGTDQ